MRKIKFSKSSRSFMLIDLKERLAYLLAVQSFVEKSDNKKDWAIAVSSGQKLSKEESLVFVKGMIFELNRVLAVMEDLI